MSILIDEKSRVIVQGMTGAEGSFHTREMLAYGTRVVAGVTPAKGGTFFDGKIPVHHSVREAMRRQEAAVSVIFVPAHSAADAIMEAADAGVALVVCITEGIPVSDMLQVMNYLARRSTRLVGPNCPGVISPGRCKVGIMPGFIHTPGRCGVISRSGTLTYEAVHQLTAAGIGQSTCIGIGGDAVIGTDFVDLLQLFEEDKATDAVALIGEIGGTAEQEAAQFIKKHMSKPVIAFISGVTAPPQRRMGHAGAIISGSSGTAMEKIRALQDAGAVVCRHPAEIGITVSRVLNS